MIWTFTFRFLRAERYLVRDITIDSADEADARAAAWVELVRIECRSLGPSLGDWRLVSVRVEPYVNAAV
jgi:hypothetical protein